MSDATRDESVTFRDTPEVVAILVRVAGKEGLQISALARMIIRKYLRAREDLSDDERRILGAQESPS